VAAFDVSSFLRAGGILALAPDRLWIAWGGWERARAPIDETASWYAPDFFLAAPDPWLIPENQMEMSWAELAGHLRQTGAGARARTAAANGGHWSEPDFAQWARVFGSLAARMQTGSLRKAVPVLFEHAAATVSESLLGSMLCKLSGIRQPVFAYGWWSLGEGMLGATPEALFSLGDPGTLSAMALAGTRPRPSGPGSPRASWTDAKEEHEHALVVEDIRAVLAAFGEVSISPRRMLALAMMDHWLTELRVALRGPADFDRVVRALHPTAALGVAPRSEGWQWLGDLETNRARGRFGAPFGVRWPDGRAHCLVAIRNIQWNRQEVLLGSGCGIVDGSRVEREWDELRLKRLSVKAMLGIEGGIG
jgi:menaquinone-specific isochorismate synthase